MGTTNAASDPASNRRRTPCLPVLVATYCLKNQHLTCGMSGAFGEGMPRSKTPTADLPATSRLVRRGATPAPRTLRLVEGGAAAHASFEQACLPHQPELYAVAMRIARDPDAAKDLVQETLLRAMVAWDSFQTGTNLRAWLFRILTNSFINGYRKRRRHQRFAVERPGDALAALYGRDQDRTDDLEDALVEDELCDEVKTALDRLGPEYRDVVERADLRGEKYKDIADALRVPIGTVMSRLFRARRVLETELAGFAARDYGIRRAA